MLNNLPEILASERGNKTLDKYLTHLLRQNRTVEAVDFIRKRFSSLSSEIAQEAAKIDPNTVTLHDWEYLVADIHHVEKHDAPVLAIGFYLSSHSDYPEPAIEVAMRTEPGPFDFTNASRDDLLKASVKYACPWTGSGSTEMRYQIESVGLGGINEALRQYEIDHEDKMFHPAPGDSPTAVAPDIYISQRLAKWYCFALVQQAVEKLVLTRGLHKNIPVMVGVHDWGLWIETIIMCDKTLDLGNRINEIRTEYIEKYRANCLNEITADIDRMNGLRSGAKPVRLMARLFGAQQSNSEKDAKKLDFQIQTSTEKRWLEIYADLKHSALAQKNSWKMTEQEYQSFIEMYRRARLNRFEEWAEKY